jgi:hypothetical protein
MIRTEGKDMPFSEVLFVEFLSFHSSSSSSDAIRRVQAAYELTSEQAADFYYFGADAMSQFIEFQHTMDRETCAMLPQLERRDDVVAQVARKVNGMVKLRETLTAEMRESFSDDALQKIDNFIERSRTNLSSTDVNRVSYLSDPEVDSIQFITSFCRNLAIRPE